jgi:hypothetical protein
MQQLFSRFQNNIETFQSNVVWYMEAAILQKGKVEIVKLTYAGNMAFGARFDSTLAQTWCRTEGWVSFKKIKCIGCSQNHFSRFRINVFMWLIIE